MRTSIGRYFAAQQLLTRLPCPDSTPWQSDELARSSAWFPSVGLLVGALAALVALVLGGTAHLRPLVVAVLCVCVGPVVTGFFHEDAWADVCDAFGGSTPQQRREIMRDSLVGSFGATGVALLLAMKVAALASMSWRTAATALLCAHVVARWSSVVMIAISRYVHDDSSLAKPYAGQVTVGRLLFATFIPTAPLCFWLFGVPLTLAVLIVTVVLVWLTSRFFARWLGGITGDCLGFVNQLIEASMYVVISQPNLADLVRHV